MKRLLRKLSMISLMLGAILLIPLSSAGPNHVTPVDFGLDPSGKNRYLVFTSPRSGITRVIILGGS